jgi:hypothetical protein
MEGIVRAHGRTIVLLKDDTPESLDRFETFMGGLGLAPGLQRHNAGIRTHATRRDPRQATWGTSTASAQGITTATLGAA